MSAVNLSEVIFVFGSNLAGKHGKGAALSAKNYFGAKYGMPFGHVGKSYGVPTKSASLKILSLMVIRHYVKNFIQYAKDNPQLDFLVTRFGCELAGYRDEDIAPMLNDAPANCILPDAWNTILDRNIRTKINLANDIGMDESDFQILSSNFRSSTMRRMGVS